MTGRKLAGKSSYGGNKASSAANGVSDRHVIRREELLWGTRAFLIENGTSKGHVISRKEVKF